MACPTCLRRSALIATLAPTIARLQLNHHALLALLALPNEQLLHAAKLKDPRGVSRDDDDPSLPLSLELPNPTRSVPTALCRHDPDYPETLTQLPCAPAVLYATCTTQRLRELLARPTIALLGSRDYSPYARQITFELARDLARAGVTVLSDVNEGLEGIAHHGALHTHGSTIAVIACSPDSSPRIRHDHLHQRILAHDAAISELPPGFTPHRGCAWPFIASQRTIAALTNPVVLVEAAGRSCALLTTHIATDLGHDVAVVPGRVTDPGGRWLLELLRDGAHPVADAQDVLELIYGAGVRGVAA
ncbi:MAG TPA: DNA-processing protein DprA [Solirubrobacteraceae bacterium]